ncbi:MAG: hypothetical protein KKA42_07235 [candidate division Zixibacteria bacterium]|nr:hypothetical protein [candidate division Zixibacteria bacterium]
MSQNPDRKDPAQSPTALAFFGAVTASVSHELNNVISIVDQTAGLLSDLLAGPDPASTLTAERLERIATSISTQTERGVTIIKRLNTFAHTTDEDRIDFELNETVSNLAELVRRLADRRRVTLTVESAPLAITLSGSPFTFQELLFACFQALLEHAEAGNTLHFSVLGSDTVPVVAVACDRPQSAEAMDLGKVERLADLVGGRFTVISDDTHTAIELHFS